MMSWITDRGAIAQLGERLVRNEEARGSNPLSSTTISRNMVIVWAHPISRECLFFMDGSATGKATESSFLWLYFLPFIGWGFFYPAQWEQRMMEQKLPLWK